MSTPLVFAYGSLVSRASAEQTFGEPLDVVSPARLRGWRRRWSTARDNLASEKRFEPVDGGEPFRYCLGLGVEPDRDSPGPNGALLRLSDAQLERLDLRELRYRRVDVTAAVDADIPASARVITYMPRPEHHRPEPPPDAVILGTYLDAVEAAFAELGPDELELFRASTDEPPVDVVAGILVADRIPPGNPRTW